MEVRTAEEVLFLAADQATRRDSGRAKSSLRLRTSTAMAISVAWAASVWERSASPITGLKRPIWASTRARWLYRLAACQPNRPFLAISWMGRSRCVGAVSAVSLSTASARGVYAERHDQRHGRMALVPFGV